MTTVYQEARKAAEVRVAKWLFADYNARVHELLSVRSLTYDILTDTIDIVTDALMAERDGGDAE